MAALGHLHLCPYSEHSCFSPCSWRGAGTKPQQGTEPLGKKAEFPPRPSPKAARIQPNPGKARLPPPWPQLPFVLRVAAKDTLERRAGRAALAVPQKLCSALDTQVDQAPVGQALSVALVTTSGS